MVVFLIFIIYFILMNKGHIFDNKWLWIQDCGDFNDHAAVINWLDYLL